MATLDEMITETRRAIYDAMCVPPHMLRGVQRPTWNGYNITVDAHWPREYVGDEVYSYLGHPFWQWLRRKTGLGYGLSMERGPKIMRDHDMLVAGTR